jgi:putative ABC transport system permease protein
MLYKHVLHNLLSNKVRALVSLLGVLIGVAALVVMLSVGRMASDFAINNLKNMGSNLLSVSLYNDKNKVSITNKQLDFLFNTKGVLDLSAIAYWSLPVDISASIIGVDSNIFSLLNLNVEQGRVFMPWDMQEWFCVIGYDVAKQLKRTGVFPVVGSWLNIGNNAFEVIGVLNKASSNYFISFDLDRSVLISRAMVMRLGGKSVRLNSVLFKIMPSKISEVQAYLNNVFNQWYKAQVFFRNSAELIQQIQEQKQSFTWLLICIAIISLLVGGVGVMNVMLIALTERKQEIALRIALGATERDIRLLFLIESLYFFFIGWCFGVLGGVSVVFIIAMFTGWNFAIDYISIALSLVLSILSGLFGLFPALQASSVDLQDLFTHY